MQQSYHLDSKMPLIIMGVMIAICMVVIVPFAFVNLFVAIVSAAIVIITIAIANYMAIKKLQYVRLYLDETGVRKMSVYGENSILWSNIRGLTIKRNRKGAVKVITAVSRSGRRLLLAGYNDMNAIAEFMESHANSLEPQSTMERFLSKPTVRWIAIGVFYTGFAFVIFGRTNSMIRRIAPFLIIVGLLPVLWQYRQNLLSTARSKSAWKHFSKTVLVNVVLAIGMTIFVLVIIFIKVKIID
jgi:hypothetical protein